VLAKVADARVAEWGPKLAGKSLDEKVDALRSLYLESDAFMEVVREGEDLLLYERNCPYLEVAMRRPGLCSVSVNVLTRLLGARVVREERFQAGHGRCVFRVKTGEKARPRGFAPEPALPKS
jgi:predicted ArsR family transcriptional regulator